MSKAQELISRIIESKFHDLPLSKRELQHFRSAVMDIVKRVSRPYKPFINRDESISVLVPDRRTAEKLARAIESNFRSARFGGVFHDQSGAVLPPEADVLSPGDQDRIFVGTDSDDWEVRINVPEIW